MTQFSKSIGPMDVWHELQALFEENDTDDNPELYLANFSPDQFRACIIHLLETSRSVISQFLIPDTEIPVQPTSPSAAANALMRGTLSASFWVEYYAFPPLTVYIEQPNSIYISYSRQEWTAVSVLGLFDLLTQITSIAPTTQLYPDTYCFTSDEQTKFLKIWRQYHHAAV